MSSPCFNAPPSRRKHWPHRKLNDLTPLDRECELHRRRVGQRLQTGEVTAARLVNTIAEAQFASQVIDRSREIDPERRFR
jgi:hypothetical protein